MSVEYRFEVAELDDRLSGYESIPYETVLALESALIRIFNATQNDVHILTGRLKASGRIDSSSSDDTWEGVITYGGQGVEYAAIEHSRGGDHAFLQVARDMESSIGIAFRTGWE